MSNNLYNILILQYWTFPLCSNFFESIREESNISSYFGRTDIILAGVCILFNVQGSVSSSVAGLALANLFQVCTFISFLMKLKAEYR